jgi:hypothetical protein
MTKPTEELLKQAREAIRKEATQHGTVCEFITDPEDRERTRKALAEGRKWDMDAWRKGKAPGDQ